MTREGRVCCCAPVSAPAPSRTLEVEMSATRLPLRSSAPAPVALRARYARTAGDMLTGGVNPGDGPPALWWFGLDTGGGAYPIGPNGPWSDGWGAGLPVVTRATTLITGPLTAAPFKVQELGFGGQPLGRPRWITDPCLTRPDARFPADVFPDAAKLTRGNFWAAWIRAACPLRHRRVPLHRGRDGAAGGRHAPASGPAARHLRASSGRLAALGARLRWRGPGGPGGLRPRRAGEPRPHHLPAGRAPQPARDNAT